ncbi:hypothetical protein GCM10027398_46330 [Azotobacter salinestris]
MADPRLLKGWIGERQTSTLPVSNMWQIATPNKAAVKRGFDRRTTLSGRTTGTLRAGQAAHPVQSRLIRAMPDKGKPCAAAQEAPK